MNGIVNFETFLLAGILLNLTPGNDTIFILSRSIAQGKQAGILSALGIAAGSVIHTVLAAFGLSFIIAKSIIIFSLIKYAGAVYLIYIGYKMLTGHSKLADASNRPEEKIKRGKIFLEAMITNVLNPKVALFFIAFLPQFLDTTSNNTVLPFLLLGITFTVTGTIWCLVLASFASAISHRLQNNRKLSGYINKACGLVLISLGIKVALSGKK